MGVKNLLSDTDHARGQDARFSNAVVIGRVTKIEVTEKGANVRVILPDRKDHSGTPLITKPIPVMQIASTAKKSFAIPRIGTPVALIKLANGTSDYLLVGSFYTKNDPPPVTDAMLDYVVYDDGSTQQFDASSGELTWRLLGDMLWENEAGGQFIFVADVLWETEGFHEINAASVDVFAEGEINLEAPVIRLTGDVIIEGNILHEGDMLTSGVHEDINGFHIGGAGPSSAKRDELLSRIEALESRLAALEGAKA